MSIQLPIENETRVIDPRKADADYKPFPSFAKWSKSLVDTSRWDRYTVSIGNRGEISLDLLRRAQQVVAKAAAVDTGAIEGLYETDRGFTFTVATETALWQAVIEEKKGPKVRALIESQLSAYDYVLDFATKQVPFGEAWIRALHEEVCRSQETYTAYTEIGVQELPLPKGEYKHLPNHVLVKNGKIHSYAPVDLTPAEMHRLCDELNSAEFQNAHAVLQSSYAHYAFAVIHPFADGNGRVARALGSVFTYRSSSIPLLILAENRADYLSTLRSADEEDYQPFVDFTLERGLDAIRLFDESLSTALAPLAEDSLAALRRLYVTKGGYTHKEVDVAGSNLTDLLVKEIAKHQERIRIEGMVGFNYSTDNAGYPVRGNAYRLPLSAPLRVSVSLSAAAPAHASVSRTFGLEVPKDCGKHDDLIMRNILTGDAFEVRITELLPAPTASLQMLLSMFVERVINELANELSIEATRTLKG